MKIAVIGAGFTGLSAAHELSKNGHTVIVFEKDINPGGLALGYKESGWEWSLEKHYHHWFTNDKFILGLAKEIGYEVVIKRPKTSIYVKNNTYQLDSPLSVLKFPPLSILERLRMSVVLGFLKFNPFWKPLEKYEASTILPKFMGKKPYEMIWEPLFVNKFGKYSNNVSLAWFWARIVKRTSSLAYPKGGYLNFASELVNQLKKRGCKFYFQAEITKLVEKNSKVVITYRLNEKTVNENFDKVIVTIPSFMFLKLAPQLPKSYKNNLAKLKGLGAINLVLRLKKSFFNDGTYWLNICDKNSPVMAIVEHTNFINNKNYNGEHILYLGNYKEASDAMFSMSKDEVLNKFDPYLRKLNQSYRKNVIDYQLFKDNFAQPVIPINYSKLIPPFNTPLKNVYLANIEQVYPWDRGTNYAVELGKKIANLVSEHEK